MSDNYGQWQRPPYEGNQPSSANPWGYTPGYAPGYGPPAPPPTPYPYPSPYYYPPDQQVVWYSQPSYEQLWQTQNRRQKTKANVQYKPPKLWGWLVVAMVAALIGSIVGAASARVLIANNERTIVKEYFPSPNSVTKPTSIQAILAADLPAVVTIQATAVGVLDEGTGMIITSDGEVLTNNHVVAGASATSVTLYGQTTQLAAKVLGTYPSKDLALLQIQNVKNLPTIKLGDSSVIQQGDSVVAIGNALGLAGGPTVTSGIVSALNRSISTTLENTGYTENLTGLIQTDAPINSGNSGGPLVESNGDVIGINTATATSSAGNAPAENVGFAIPINSVTPLIQSLKNGGQNGAGNTPPTTSKKQPYLGVEVESLTPALAQSLGLKATSGALIVAVVPGAPADASGMQVNDVIIAINKKPVVDANSLRSILSNLSAGQTVDIEVVRGATTLHLVVTLTSN